MWTSEDEVAWLLSPHILNPIENSWRILKWWVYKNGSQFRCKERLWQAIMDLSRNITSDEIHKLACSIDQCLFQFTSNKVSHIPNRLWATRVHHEPPPRTSGTTFFWCPGMLTLHQLGWTWYSGSKHRSTHQFFFQTFTLLRFVRLL